MSTISIAKPSKANDPICQGDIFQSVKYNYIYDETDTNVNVLEYKFTQAIIISQACDVISMEKMLAEKKGKITKFMPSILMCPIYNKDMVKDGTHIEDIFSNFDIQKEYEVLYHSDDLKVAKRDWHYRFHFFTLSVNGKKYLDNSLIDFKHYFTVPMSYLISHKNDRIFNLDPLFAEQLTLKFATYLSRVAIPD